MQYFIWRPIPISPPVCADFRLDLELNQLTTVAVLEEMKAHNVRRLFFASTSAIFGETDALLFEDFAPLRPISFYGASKLAAEAYISVFAHTFGGLAVILRFPNVVGERATHGVIYDFLRKLESNPSYARSARRWKTIKTLPVRQRLDRCDANRMGQSEAHHWRSITLPESAIHRYGKSQKSLLLRRAELILAWSLPVEIGAGRAMCRGSATTLLGCELWAGSRSASSTDAVRHAVARILANGF